MHGTLSKRPRHQHQYLPQKLFIVESLIAHFRVLKRLLVTSENLDLIQSKQTLFDINVEYFEMRKSEYFLLFIDPMILAVPPPQEPEPASVATCGRFTDFLFDPEEVSI